MLMMSGMEMSHAGRSDSRLVGETPKHINDDQTTVPHELEKRVQSCKHVSQFDRVNPLSDPAFNDGSLRIRAVKEGNGRMWPESSNHRCRRKTSVYFRVRLAGG